MSRPLTAVLLLGITLPARAQAPTRTSDDEALVTLFKEFRELQKPKFDKSVPDYRPEALAAQRRQLESAKARLAAIDTSAWPISRKVDYLLVNLREFHDQFLLSGMVPIALIGWEMTGLESQVEKLWPKETAPSSRPQ